MIHCNHFKLFLDSLKHRDSSTQNDFILYEYATDQKRSVNVIYNDADKLDVQIINNSDYYYKWKRICLQMYEFNRATCDQKRFFVKRMSKHQSSYAASSDHNEIKYDLVRSKT